MNQPINTRRLTLELLNPSQHSQLTAQQLSRIVQMLTPKVVQWLPPAFHNIDTIEQAQAWFTTLKRDSQVWAIKEGQQLAGLLLLHIDDKQSAHLGYLLAEEFWHQGLAFEGLSQFINFAKQQPWQNLMAGVHQDNLGSVHLLSKLGFIAMPGDNTEELFYKLNL